MPLLTVEQCRAHCKIEVLDEAIDAELMEKLASAEVASADFLNRALFADDAARAAALAALPAAAAAAQDEFDTAMAAADAEANAAAADAMRAIAREQLAQAQTAARHTVVGIVADDAVLAAVRLTLGHLWANREDVVIGATAVEIPAGARALLRPKRRVMMP